MKARLKFSKTGSMRFIGHLDVMRYFQKAFRRASIPVAYSKGYSPHQILSFTSPLGIGLTSDAEYLDMELTDDANVEGIVEKINTAMNDEITAKDFVVLSDDAKPSMAMLAACDYLVAVKPGKTSFLQDAAKRKEILERFLAQDSIEIMKKTKRSEKLVDIRHNIYHASDEKGTFEAMTGENYGESCLDIQTYEPVLYLQLTAGSIVNIKPELVLQGMCQFAGEEFEPMNYQVHRLEMYGDANGKKGEIHLMDSEIPCKLVPLSRYI